MPISIRSAVGPSRSCLATAVHPGRHALPMRRRPRPRPDPGPSRHPWGEAHQVAAVLAPLLAEILRCLERIDDEIEPVVAEEHLVADKERGRPEDAALGGGLGRRAELLAIA